MCACGVDRRVCEGLGVCVYKMGLAVAQPPRSSGPLLSVALLLLLLPIDSECDHKPPPHPLRQPHADPDIGYAAAAAPVPQSDRVAGKGIGPSCIIQSSTASEQMTHGNRPPVPHLPPLDPPIDPRMRQAQFHPGRRSHVG